MAGWRGEVEIIRGLGGPLAAAKAHGNDRYAGLAAGVVDGGKQVAEIVGVGLDEEDLGSGGDGMGPFDIEADFQSPALVGGGEGGAAILIDLGEAGGRGDAQGGVE